MKAIVIVPGLDARPTLALQQVDAPQPGPADLLVRVRAAGLNRADLQRRQQHYAAGPINIAGLEMAGEVIGMGADVQGFSIGDHVMSQAQGCYAEQVKVDHRVVMHKPAAYNWIEAAALPVIFPTAHDAMVTNGGLRAGATMLVQAVSSGVGIAAIQIGRLLGAGRLFGTSSSADKLARLAALGLHRGIDTTREDFAQVVKAETNDAGVNLIIDNVGRGTLAGHLACAALGAHIVTVGRMGGAKDELDLDQLALKRIHLIGVTFRTRSIAEKQAVNGAFLRDLGAALERKQLDPLVERVYPLDQALQAQETMRANKHLGKLVLEL